VGRAEAAADEEALVDARCSTATGRWRRACWPSVRTSTSATRACWRCEALLDVKQQVAPYLDLQLVAFPQDGVLRAPERAGQPASARSTWAWTWSAASRTSSAPWPTAPSRCGLLCELAAERGLRVDMHCDESDDPLSRHIETLAFHTQRLGLQGRVTGSHLTSMHSMDNYYVSKLLPLIAEAGVHAVANPLINITLQGRHDSYPKRRGMTRVPELMAAGVNVGFGHDCVMDPWYSLGSGDMLEVAAMGLHVAQMTSQQGMRAVLRRGDGQRRPHPGPAGYGLEVGCRADFVLLQARSPVEAIRLRAPRLLVVRGGQVLARTPERHRRPALPGPTRRGGLDPAALIP
jgi:cytosine deaminase